MRILQGIKRTLKPLVDFPTWMGTRGLIDNGKAVIQDTKDLFTPVEAGPPENFNDAVDRLRLDSDAIQKRQNFFLTSAIVWSLITFIIFLYTVWLLITGGLVGALLSAGLTFLGLVLAFRYHFWYFQVKNRILGASLNQWLKSLLSLFKGN